MGHITPCIYQNFHKAVLSSLPAIKQYLKAVMTQTHNKPLGHK